MQAIVIKYIQLFCVAVLFDNVNCDQITLPNYKDDLLFYRTTSCAASCLKNSNKTLKECYERVCGTSKLNDTEPIRMGAANFKIKMRCRDDTSLVIEIIDDNVAHGNQSGHLKYTHKETVKGSLYMVKVERGNVWSEKIFYITDSPLIQITNLTSNATYNITATLMHSNNQYTNAVLLDSVTTLPSPYCPINITNADLKVELSKTSNKTLDMFVSWYPADDQTCHYYIYSYSTEDDFLHIPYTLIKDPELLYYYPIRNLSFGTNNSVGIQALNKNSGCLSSIKWISKVTPTCWEWYTDDKNLEICEPYKPKIIGVQESFVYRHHYRLNISWERPLRQPRSYSIAIRDNNNNNTTREVTGEKTYEYFEDVQLLDDEYEVELTAIALGGNTSSTARLSLHDVLTEATEDSQTLRILLYMGISIIAVVFVGILIATVIHLKARSKRRRYRDEYFEGLEKQRPAEIKNEDKRILLEEEIKKSFLNDGMEIDEEDINILNTIGEGAFGFVNRGILLPTGKEVAVKRLKDVVTFDVMRNFCQEVEVMRSVDKHPNIVGIVGHFMKDIERMMILTEYCSRGNLLDFLRDYWQRIMKCSLSKGPPAEDCQFIKPEENEVNFGSSIPEKNLFKHKNIRTVNDDVPLCIKNLIINKLYDESIDNTQSYAHDCGNTCKSYVDIIEDKVKVSVKDCECRENQKNKMLNYLDLPNSIVENRGYDGEYNLKQLPNGPDRFLTNKDLLSFALQIATGMEFLSFNKVVHRDLAARNVCVCSDYTVKIADFGLSRDIYQENVYKKATDGKLPIKWLALESMTFQMYTSQSDVWSYGILLYEIVTLGSTPYPSIQTGNLLKLLMSGYRMEKPPNCDDNVYELMLSCWRTVPNERPTFTEIKLKLERLIAECKEDQSMHNDKFENNSKSITSSGSYLTPLQL